MRLWNVKRFFERFYSLLIVFNFIADISGKKLILKNILAPVDVSVYFQWTAVRHLLTNMQLLLFSTISGKIMYDVLEDKHKNLEDFMKKKHVLTKSQFGILCEL